MGLSKMVTLVLLVFTADDAKSMAIIVHSADNNSAVNEGHTIVPIVLCKRSTGSGTDAQIKEDTLTRGTAN